MNTATSEILFEKFEIIEVLKKDEHAAVFLANHIYLSKKIILKVLNTQKISDQSLVERFKREAKILAKLDHPNIIKVLDFGMFKEFFYISFEYIDGFSLRNLMKKGELSFDQKKHLMIQILKSLYYAHLNQIIHRDIKPENIFIDNALNVKLGDFGLALSSEDNFITNPYSVVGTPSYMSPEQVRGAKLTAQSDLFSVGVVLFELFTGKNPFLRDNVNLTLNEIMSYDENAVAKQIENLPQEIKDVLYHLLRKNLKDRYSTAQEVLDDLKVSIDQPTLVINNFDERRAQRNRMKSIAAIATVAVAFIFFIIIKLLDNKPQPNDSPPTNLKSVQQNDPAQIPQNSTVKNPDGDKVDLTKLDNALIDKKQEAPKQNQDVNQQPQNNNTQLVSFGGLVVDVQPWAKIYIDNTEVGTTPKTIRLQKGEYTLKLVHPDYQVISQPVVINTEQVTQVKIRLDDYMGFIRCDVRPEGTIYINEESKGVSPPPPLIRVKPGPVHLVIKEPNYKEVDTSFYINRGDTLRYKFILKKK